MWGRNTPAFLFLLHRHSHRGRCNLINTQHHQSISSFRDYSARRNQRRGWSGFGADQRDENQHQHRRSNIHHASTVVIDVPVEACGLIVGKKGRNIKELNELDGIAKRINVDFQRGKIYVTGTNDAIDIVKRRVDMAINLATNSAGLFPEYTLTCFLGDEEYHCFRKANSFDSSFSVRMDQLDEQRDYYVFAGTESKPSNFKHNEDDEEDDNENVALPPQDKIVVGFRESAYRAFFDRVLRKNRDVLCESSKRTYIQILFGKTFFSSIPGNVLHMKTLTREDIASIPYGVSGLRSEFVPNLSTDQRTILERLVADEGYVKLNSECGKFIIVQCIHQQSRKRYTIKLRQEQRGDDEDGNGSFDVDTIRLVSAARSCSEVLGVGFQATMNDIKIAYRRKALILDPDKNNHPLAGKAMTIVNEAKKVLMDYRASHATGPLPSTRPQNKFEYKAPQKIIPLPDVQEFYSRERKIAHCSLLRGEAPQMEFRTTIGVNNDEAVISSDIRSQLQEAWDRRSDDGKLQFGNGCLLVDATRYTERTVLTDGTFLLTIKSFTQEYFGKSISGWNLSLESCDINDTLEDLRQCDDLVLSNLVHQTCDLQQEAMRLSAKLQN